MQPRFAPALAFGLAALAGFAQSAACADAAPVSQSPLASPPAANVAPSTQGLLIAIDPVTHQWRMPTAEEAQALGTTRPKAQRAPPQVLAMPAGGPGKMVRLDASFENYVVVGKNADGSLAMDCVTGEGSAAHAMASGVHDTMGEHAHRAPEPLDVK